MIVSQRTADEVAHRRGMVLGLTLAELLLLLLFMLLLALTWRLTEMKKDLDSAYSTTSRLERDNAGLLASVQTLQPLAIELQRSGKLDVKTVQDLALRLATLETVEKELQIAKQSRAELWAQLMALRASVDNPKKLDAISEALAAAATINPDDPPTTLVKAVEAYKAFSGVDLQPKELSAFKDALLAASKIDPNAPAATLQRGIDILGRLGADTKPEQVRPLDQLMPLDQVQKTLVGVEAERDKYRAQVSNLSRSGNGRTLPSCWITDDGQTEYMFDVSITDDGLIVKDATPSRKDDPAWKLIDGFPRNAVIHENTFDKSTNAMFAWSKKENCRFYSIIRDGTGDTSKERYKKLRRTVENHFYPLHLDLTAVVRRAPPDGSNTSGIGGPYVPAPLPRNPTR